MEPQVDERVKARLQCTHMRVCFWAVSFHYYRYRYSPAAAAAAAVVSACTEPRQDSLASPLVFVVCLAVVPSESEKWTAFFALAPI